MILVSSLPTAMEYLHATIRMLDWLVCVLLMYYSIHHGKPSSRALFMDTLNLI